jgi:pyruvate dehydrogenase E1 component alpha subunit
MTPAIDREHGLHLLREMLRIRRFEERCVELYSASKIRGFLHLYIGEEAVAVGAMQALDEEDAVLTTYREHGHALVRGVPARAVMAEMFGKAAGCSRGRGGSMHLFDAAHNFYGGNAIVAGGLRSRWGSRWPIAWPAARASWPASSARARWPRASSTSR